VAPTRTGSGPLPLPPDRFADAHGGYDGRMSQSPSEPESSDVPSDSDSDDTTQPPDDHTGAGAPGDRETPDVGLVSDEQLPEDLQPGKNPLAKDPDDDTEEGSASAESPDKVEGMPDMGNPGVAG
jgi:hypothetical protein